MQPRPKKLELRAADGLLVTADVYARPRSNGSLVLCHRSHFNRGEYKDIAPRLQENGYACLALDQRSGMNVLGYENETYQRAKRTKLSTGYIAARPDIEAAVALAFRRNRRRPIILVGSSYSASLALMIAAESKMVGAVVAFSPGEYLKGVLVAEGISKIGVPVFATGAREEIDGIQSLLEGVPRKLVTLYRPSEEGRHGARVLWPATKESEDYWKPFLAFLKRVTTRT